MLHRRFFRYAAMCLPLLTVSAVSNAQTLPAGFAKTTVSTSTGSVTVTFPQRKISFNPNGDTYYISRSGSDNNDGSYSRPWATIYRALNTLGAGDLVYLRGGDYYTPFTVTRSGSPGNPIVISSYPGEPVRILQPTNWQKNNYHAATVCLSKAEYVWIHGLEIQGCRGRSDAPSPDGYAQNCVTLANGAGKGVYIVNNVLSRALHCGVKEMGHGGSRFVVEGNVIFDNGVDTARDHGIYIPSNDAVIRGNAVFRNASYGIHLYSKPQRLHVYNNVCFENNKDGILQAGGYAVIAHNVATYGRTGIKLFRSNCTYNQFKNNITFNNDYCQMGLDNGGGKYPFPTTNTISYGVAYPSSDWYLPSLLMSQKVSGMQIKDPKVTSTSSHDYRLQSDSPVRGKVTSVSMKGCLSWPDPGIFPATQYTEPTW